MVAVTCKVYLVSDETTQFVRNWYWKEWILILGKYRYPILLTFLLLGIRLPFKIFLHYLL